MPNTNPKLETPCINSENGQLELLSHKDYEKMDHTALRVWCHKNARYGLPTRELIIWLDCFIADRKAIEIGSGHGDLAFHLGIKGTDSKCQDMPDVKAWYKIMGQPTIKYPKGIEKIEALDAVKKYKPDIVLGSWITEWIDPKLPPPPHGGSVYGVKEDLLLETGVTYILIGNLAVHGKKKIMKLDHRELEYPFIKSRSSQPSLDRLLIWGPG